MQDNRENFQTDTLHSVMQSIHYAGASAMQMLEKAADSFFSGDLIVYGGAQQGNEVTGSGVTIKEGPGTKVVTNPDGSKTVTKTSEDGTKKTVLEFDKDGNHVGTKLVSIETTANGGVYQRTVDQNGNIRDITLVHGGEGQKANPKVYFDQKTGQTTIVAVNSADDLKKTVTNVNENGEIIGRRQISYDVMDNGAVIERSVDIDGHISQKTIISGSADQRQSVGIKMHDNGMVFATTHHADGTKSHAIISSNSSNINNERVSYIAKSDGSVIERRIGVNGVTEVDIVQAAEGAGTPDVMHRLGRVIA